MSECIFNILFSITLFFCDVFIDTAVVLNDLLTFNIRYYANNELHFHIPLHIHQRKMLSLSHLVTSGRLMAVYGVVSYVPNTQQ